MDLDKIIEQMHAERDRLDISIRALEVLVAAGPKRRGRPPKWMTGAAVSHTPGRRGRPRANTKHSE